MLHKALKEQLRQANKAADYWQEKCNAAAGRMTMREKDIETLTAQLNETRQRLKAAEDELEKTRKLNETYSEHIRMLNERFQQESASAARIAGKVFEALSGMAGKAGEGK